MAGHRYWRLVVDHTYGHASGWGAEAREIEFRGVRDGADLTGAGTPLSDAGTPANAFDNNFRHFMEHQYFLAPLYRI